MYTVDLAKLELSSEDSAALEVSKAAREDWRVEHARMTRGSSPNKALYWAALTAEVEKAEKTVDGHSVDKLGGVERKWDFITDAVRARRLPDGKAMFPDIRAGSHQVRNHVCVRG